MGRLSSIFRELQSAESAVREVQNRVNRARARVHTHASRLKQLQESLNERQNKHRHLQSQQRQFELEMESKEEDIAKIRLQLNQARNNKEYSAILAQINIMRADDSKIQDIILDIMAQVDSARENMESLKDKLDQEQAKQAGIENEAKKEVDDCERLMAQFKDKRSAAAAQLPPDALAMFQRAAETYDGEGLAEVVQVNPKRQEFACAGCNMSLPMEMANALMTRDDLFICPNCRRALCLADELTT